MFLEGKTSIYSETDFHRLITLTVSIALGILIFFGAEYAAAGLVPPGLYVALPLIGHVAAAALCILVVLGAWSRSEMAHEVGLCALIVAVFMLHGLILYFTLAYAAPSQWLIWGTFPNNDAGDFHSSAINLLWDGNFYTPRGRPVANSLIAGLLALTSFDIHALISINLLLAALAVSLIGITAWSTHGPLAAVILCAILYDFTLDHGVTMSSELMGFIIGAASFVFLWLAAYEKKAVLFLLGMASLSLAMVVRAGPMFVIPALLVWAALYPFPGQTSRWRLPAIALAIVIAVFGANSVISKYVTPTSGGSFVNAAKSWYAVFANGREALGITPSTELTRGARWTQIYKDNPGLKTLPGKVRVEKEFEILVDQAVTYPLAGLVGVWLEYKDYFLLQGLLNFIENKWARHFYFLLAAFGGFAMIFRARRDRFAAFLLAGNLGIFASLPFLHGGITRVLAGALGFTASLAVFGALVIAELAARNRQRQESRRPAIDKRIAVGASTAIVGGIVALSGLTFAGMFRFDYVERPPDSCASGETYALLHYSPGASVRIVTDQMARGSGLPHLTLSDAWKTVSRWESIKTSNSGIGKLYYDAPHWSRLPRIAQDLGAPLTIVLAPDAVTGKLRKVYIPGWVGPESDKRLSACMRQRNGQMVVRASSLSIETK